jgi:hypothetical protein
VGREYEGLMKACLGLAWGLAWAYDNGQEAYSCEDLNLGTDMDNPDDHPAVLTQIRGGFLTDLALTFHPLKVNPDSQVVIRDRPQSIMDDHAKK